MASDGARTRKLDQCSLQDDPSIASVAAELKKRRQRRLKRGRTADVQLKTVRPPLLTSVVHQDVSDPSLRLAAITQHLEQIDKLPWNSAFAKHRRHMLLKALELLDRDNTADSASELTRLLEQLGIK